MITPKNLLALTDYTVSRCEPKTRINGLDVHKKRLKSEAPDFVGQEIEGYKLLGKTSVFQQFIASKSGKYFAIKLKRSASAVAKVSTKTTKVVQEKDLSKMNLKTVKLKDVHFDDSLFIPLKSKSPIDYCFSKEGGIMPGTNYIVVGDPGVGKSSVTIEHAACVQIENPGKKVLFISGEMTKLDMKPYTKRFPKWDHLECLFIGDLTDGLYKESIEAKLAEGFDMVLGDSFAEIADAVRGDYNETVKGADKKSYNEIEKWMVDLMVKHNEAANAQKLHTCFVFIQQVTKGGDFVGSNKLKHNTTGMIELRFTKSGDRKVVVTKNRRGFEYDNLHFDFTESTEKPISYDTDRIMRDLKVADEIKKAASEQLDQERETDAWFDALGAEPVGEPIAA